MKNQRTAQAAKVKTLWVAFETYPQFSDAACRLKELTRDYGSGGKILRSDSGHAILATPAFLARIGASQSRTRTPPAAHSPSSSGGIETAIVATAIPVPFRAPVTHNDSTQARIEGALAVGPAPFSPRGYSSAQGNPRDAFNRSRLQKMALELQHAFQQLPPDVARSWTGNVVKRLGSSFTRRLGNVVDVSIFVLETTGELVIDLTQAIWNGRAMDHIKKKTLANAAAGAEVVEKAGHALRGVLSELRTRPAQIAPELLVSSLAFFVVGGGLDGDGGVPDLDIQIFGIGGHRSIFSHSIVAGTLIETSLYSLVDLVAIAHTHLPASHDPLWDSIHSRSRSLAEGATRGASAGLAYHLAVDSIIQPAAYRDLPFPAPIEVHQAITGANATSEGAEAIRQAPKSGSSGSPSSTARARKLPDTKAEKMDATKAAKVAVGGALAIAAWFFS